MSKKQVYLESLGCARNTVDSEIMLGRLKNAGWSATKDPALAETIVINTCSFIEPAVNESIDTILELAGYKRSGACKRLIVVGCLPERYREKIAKELPEIDVFLGTGAFDQVVEAVEGRLNRKKCLFPDPNFTNLLDSVETRLQSHPHMAYLKIAEGCSRRCTYCIIPNLRGKLRSRPMDTILTEARRDVSSGVKELVLVAQDTTAYGNDLTPSQTIGRLLSELSALSEDIWIRVMYGHPESIDDEFLKTASGLSNICPYFDIPIQHVSSRILKRMGRNYTEQDLYHLFDRIRDIVPGAVLRTTIITGFPGETENDVEQLTKFMDTVKFDHLGVFIYSDSEDLPSHKLDRHVPGKTAKNRHDRIMSHQQAISSENNRKHLNRIYTILVDEEIEKDVFAGRTIFQAPEVDGITYIHSRVPLKTGSFIKAGINDTLEYDLIGEPV
ncbi:MAG TPA: 30S ribosomal protein S12 methylthiotransferase RimO [Deltaproteobacteria bacterium]|nr:30S ribosomal protein S12 methylthiotransferase RimO [Deltaproteobacteria bacterium]